jgi:hypothetical protein
MRGYVGADGKLVEPLSSEVVVMFTEHLIQKKVPWPHAEVAGTSKHLAVKTVTNFFAAVNFSFALRSERIPPELAQFFYNTRKSYALKIAKLKDEGLHPDKTNSIGVNFSVYERICLKLGSYVAHFQGSCYSCWRDLWLFWIFLFNLLGRCLQVSKICYDWIWWQDDALVVKVPTQKGVFGSGFTHHIPPPHHLAAVHCHSPYTNTIHHPHTTLLLFTVTHHTPYTNTIHHPDTNSLLFTATHYTPTPYTTTLTITLGDQSGSMSYWKRLYANPFNPGCCPVLALGVQLLCITPGDPYTNRVFTTTGDQFRNRFSKFMLKAFPTKLVDELPIHRITSHSPKRGGICMASGNEVVKWEAVELRADHKCGLTSTYQTCAAPQQDGIMGRLFSGLAFGTEQFNVIAPHFKPEDVLQVPFQEFITHYTKYSTTFKTVIPFLLASVVFHLHNGKLKQLLPKEHPFWASQFVLQHRRVWTQLGSKVRYTTMHHHTPLRHCSLRFWVARWAQSLY